MIAQLRKDYPEYDFVANDIFIWSPETKTVYYNPQQLDTDIGKFSLLHEVSHALAGHDNYSHDIDLLKYELEAWELAKSIAGNYSIVISQDYIENCLDSYRDWLKKRSTCPDCSYVNFQSDHVTYVCFNCGCNWKVPVSQVCRIQRRKVTA